jgi:phosphatidate phosphatase APP1
VRSIALRTLSKSATHVVAAGAMVGELLRKYFSAQGIPQGFQLLKQFND